MLPVAAFLHHPAFCPGRPRNKIMARSDPCRPPPPADLWRLYRPCIRRGHSRGDATVPADYAITTTTTKCGVIQVIHCLAIPVADVPHVSHAASLDWMQKDEESRPYTQYRPIERQEHAAAERACWHRAVAIGGCWGGALSTPDRFGSTGTKLGFSIPCWHSQQPDLCRHMTSVSPV